MLSAVRMSWSDCGFICAAVAGMACLLVRFPDSTGRLAGRTGDASMLGTFLTAIDWFGVAIFAVTGALVASRKRMDIFGFALLATVTGIGGGSMRDLLLGVPVFWVGQPLYVGVCVAVAA